MEIEENILLLQSQRQEQMRNELKMAVIQSIVTMLAIFVVGTMVSNSISPQEEWQRADQVHPNRLFLNRRYSVPPETEYAGINSGNLNESNPEDDGLVSPNWKNPLPVGTDQSWITNPRFILRIGTCLSRALTRKDQTRRDHVRLSLCVNDPPFEVS